MDKTKLMQEVESYNNRVEILKLIGPVIKKHNLKPFAKRFKNDLESVFKPLGYNVALDSSSTLLNVYIYKTWDQRERVFIGHGKIDFETFERNVKGQVEYAVKASNELQAYLVDQSRLDQVQVMGQSLKALIEQIDSMPYQVREELKKQFDFDFKNYYRG